MVQSKRGSVATLQPPNGYLAQQELNGHRVPNGHGGDGRGDRVDRDHRRNLKNEDNLYFIVDDKGNGALSPEMALPQSAQNGLRPINGMEAMNGMNGGSGVRTDRRRRESPRRQRMQSPRHAEQDLNDWMSRTEILEDENVRLKSDVRKLKKAVRDLNNTVQQIMQTLQQQ